MAEKLKLISTEAARPVLPRFMQTETAADILHSLRVVYQNPGDAVGLICGAPGVGKSRAVQHFASLNRQERNDTGGAKGAALLHNSPGHAHGEARGAPLRPVGPLTP